MGAAESCSRPESSTSGANEIRFGLPTQKCCSPDCSQDCSTGCHRFEGERNFSFTSNGLSSSSRASQIWQDGPGNDVSDEAGALEVAQEIAKARKQYTYEETSVIPRVFDVRAASSYGHPGVRLAVDRTTGAVRGLYGVPKPRSREGQERLRAAVGVLREIRCDGVARVLEVFEDSRNMELLVEHCPGGTVFDRILQRQCFAEQESAMLIRHVLQAVAALHSRGAAHGHLTADAFRFQGDQAHAALKLVDFGLELKAHLWDVPAVPASAASAVECRLGPKSGGIARLADDNGVGLGAGRVACLQLIETCRISFCAPEVLRLLQLRKKGSYAGGIMQRREEEAAGVAVFGGPAGLDGDFLADAIDAHLEQTEEAGDLSAADIWSAGGVAFLLLCGYPPFFAPCRYAILSRIDNAELCFDSPFWSKISEDAKDFVRRCLQVVPSRRPGIVEALEHPWIRRLADTAPNGSMLSSFALNLRRFRRTSLIETFAANTLAATLTIAELRSLPQLCRRADTSCCGFITATDLRQIIASMSYHEIADAIGACSSRSWRHPGESYLDYVVLLESVRARRERLLEESLWQRFKVTCKERCGNVNGALKANEGRLPVALLDDFLQEDDVQRLLANEGIEDAESLPQELRLEPEADFLEIICELLRQLPLS